MKKQTIFASINKKIKWFFLYFSRKYETHKAVFSTKETNLLRRGYRLSFQKEIFRHFTKNQDQTTFSIPFMTMQKIEIFWIWAQKENQIHKNQWNRQQASKQTKLKSLRGQKNFQFLNKIFVNRQFWRPASARWKALH